jgi:hypothetical protein
VRGAENLRAQALQGEACLHDRQIEAAAVERDNRLKLIEPFGQIQQHGGFFGRRAHEELPHDNEPSPSNVPIPMRKANVPVPP